MLSNPDTLNFYDIFDIIEAFCDANSDSSTRVHNYIDSRVSWDSSNSVTLVRGSLIIEALKATFQNPNLSKLPEGFENSLVAIHSFA